MPRKLFVVGIDSSGRFGVGNDQVEEMLAQCEAVVGSTRQVTLLQSQLTSPLPRKLNWDLGIDELVKEIDLINGSLFVLSSGDPGYFGIVRLLKSKLPNFHLEVYPVVSSVSLAFARAGTNWEDAAVISAHGRSYQSVLMELLRVIDAKDLINKLAVLCSPEHPPQFIAQLLLEARTTFDRYLVCTNLGSMDESVIEAPLETIAQSAFDPLSIILGIRNHSGANASISNLLPVKSGENFLHRGKMITKSEIREVVLSKLLPSISDNSSCLWDLGAGSGSVGISAIEKNPHLKVFLVEKDPIQVRLLGLNASGHSGATVVAGRSQDVIWQLPDPNAVFIGGGGLDVLARLKERLRKPTFVVQSFAALNRAAEGANQLGNLMQIMLQTGRRFPDGTWRLEGENPVFIAWGLLG